MAHHILLVGAATCSRRRVDEHGSDDPLAFSMHPLQCHTQPVHIVSKCMPLHIRLSIRHPFRALPFSHMHSINTAISSQNCRTPCIAFMHRAAGHMVFYCLPGSLLASGGLLIDSESRDHLCGASYALLDYLFYWKKSLMLGKCILKKLRKAAEH